jgi:homoserine kinase
MKKVKVRVPATTANLGPGFDVLGMAVKLYNYIEVEADVKNKVSKDRKKCKLEITVEGEGKGSISEDKKNIVYKAIKETFDKCENSFSNLHVVLKNKIPVARGLGSSAAARIGGVVAANELCGRKLSRGEILRTAWRLEGHPDNVASALLGGLVISCIGKEKASEEIRWIKLDPPGDLYTVIWYPTFPMVTRDARKVLREDVPLEDVIFTSSRVAMLSAMLNSATLIGNRHDLIAVAMDDVLHQPYRGELMPYISDVIDVAKKAGALGAALSGSGSAMLAIFQAEKKDGYEKKGKEIGEAIKNMMERKKYKNGNKYKDSTYQVLEIDRDGAMVI